MSQSDFLITAGNANGIGGTYYTGSAILNSDLSNPLTSSVNCRVYNQENINANFNSMHGLYFVSSSVSGGTLFNIPETKSVSLRLWARFTDSSFSIYQRVSLLAKHNGYNTADYMTNGSYPYSGYEFGYKNPNNGTLYYNFGNYKANTGNTSVTIPGFTNVGINQWVGLRMDIVPVRVNRVINGTPTSGTLKDIITLYTASLSTPDTWQQIYTTELPVDDNYFVPWGSYTTTGGAPVIGTVNTSSYGFSALSETSVASKTYFDDFQIFVEDAF